jgi:zinc D-Ala-D-Ala dipeptidase
MSEIYKELERQMVTYQDLISIKVIDNKEPLVQIDKEKIPFSYIPVFSDMKKVLGNTILVRKDTYTRLLKAQDNLKAENLQFSLYVTYGYRSMEIQTQRFLERLKESSSTYFQNPNDLYEEIHRSIAVPSVAGHPTGGAVDITIINLKSNRFLDFGSKQYDYSTKRYYVYCPDISSKAKYNRMLLRKCMVSAGFAPFDGEWWHFSYGDREWAYFYKKKNALYNQIKVGKLGYRKSIEK